MGNSRAYPVFRTTDKSAAYAQAARLCALLARRDDEVWLSADLRTVADVRRMAAGLPDAEIHVPVRTHDSGGPDLDLRTAADAEVQPHLPVDFSYDCPAGRVEDRFVAALGEGTAAMIWWGRWPEDLEADRPQGSVNHDGVQVVFHGDAAQWNRWTEHHTVFVHVDKWGDLPRARNLAARTGGEVLGEAQLGW
ncbi:hypothetical protein ACIPPM_29340 [Streptomyces sp. NPDC090119]|uniref:hypothetical protein n=1 Tax=Streptomyces sp. NPDC090119 TaxID=3365951 RepID=UPI003819303D